MAVHNRLGAGYKEEVYENALMEELRKLEILALSQYPVKVWDQEARVALFILDLYVEERVVVEIKAFSHQLTNDELAQVINYLKATQAPVGLLLNFGRRKLEYRRIFPGKAGGLLQRQGRDDVLKSNLPDIR